MVLSAGGPARRPGDSRPATTDQPWTGDDQEWWDWYVTTARNADDAGALVPGPVFPEVHPSAPADVAAALCVPYPVTDDQVRSFRSDGFVKLPAVVAPDVIAALADRLDHLLADEFDGDVDGRFLSLEMMWRNDPLMCAVALSPRLGGIAAALLGEPAVRLYHDNALSKQPGCGRTPWHHDADHFPVDSFQVCTSWLPLHAVPSVMGPLSFAPGLSADELDHLSVDAEGTSYDEGVSELLAARGDAVSSAPFALGDVSFHASTCFHTAGPNRTTAPRRVLSNTYMADGIRVVDHPTMLSGSWQDFLPGIAPGEPAASGYNPIVGHLPA